MTLIEPDRRRDTVLSPGIPGAPAPAQPGSGSAGGRGENLPEGVEQQVGVLALEDQRWPDLEHVACRAAHVAAEARLAYVEILP